ncbi:uncharacterized protein CEXT_363891 [Caerostris extrusa]|uniref:Uncharacterized protein n=1 Tax=Caerostris extrusa TaxID=172846 RepID=A0AAV4NV18_CAEEX|nr:uncharacterized protein CEXT_363891 [Caerostris extrusa]
MGILELSGGWGRHHSSHSEIAITESKTAARPEWQLLVDDEVSSAKSPGNSPRNSFSSTGSVASQASSSKDNRSEHGSQGSRAGLGKLARFLTSRDKSVASDRPASHGSDSSLAPDIASLRKS